MNIPSSIDETEKFIDSRNVILRLNWLESFATFTCEVCEQSITITLEDHVKVFQGHDEGCDYYGVNEFTALLRYDEKIQDYVLMNNPDCALSDDEIEEYISLLELQNELENESDWTDGITLINDNTFQKYAEDYAHETGTLQDIDTSVWPFTCIDWKQAAHELQSDYSSVNWKGTTFWYR